MTTTNATRPRLPAPVFDIGLAVLLALLASGGTVGANDGHRPEPVAFALIWAMAAFLAVRRLSPEAALAGTVAGLSVYLYLDLPPGPVFMLPAVAVFFYAFTRSVRALAIALGVLYVYTVAFHQAVEPGRSLWFIATIALLWLAIPAVGGRIAREARRARAREREAERERYRADERVEMAREIHDVVGHSLAVVSMNAGVALHTAEKHAGTPEGVVENLRAIREASNLALQDLRATLAPLRRGQAPELRPTGAISDIAALVDGVRKGGLPVEYQLTGDPAAVPVNVAATAYRVVQESLTNVIRHSGATKAVVQIACDPEALRVHILDDGRGGPLHPDRMGQGVTGMMERVQAGGGAFTAAPRPGGGFAVKAHIPYDRKEAR
ncbi:sensor histidine kinase [Glycomyces artemisiae]|uniref:histidine kinase n=1 Tax=Glycomyces artemisiae TaxID=1076443 RepID=A0A2T0UWI8_9ACTN|nr:sensor histidine kinase [Glycomyces artemisiae]PRY62299.1 signal transduction histidine kinase [Glycomyces artemisiae]